MTILRSIRLSGMSSAGPFSGEFEFQSGLNIVSAHNAYGKSTAVTAVGWALGLEPMFGLQDDDPSRFPSAVRDIVSLNDNPQARVLSSAVSVVLEKDTSILTLNRSIIGERSGVVAIQDGSDRFNLFARKHTMADATGGLQHYLFDWLGFERVPLMTQRGKESQLYLENLAPHFLVDQVEGWAEIQALQVHRYGLIEVAQASVEYLLGAKARLDKRFSEQVHDATAGVLKAKAAQIAEGVAECFASQGWTYELSTQGSPLAIARRWAEIDIIDDAKSRFNLDFPNESQRIEKHIAELRRRLSAEPLDRYKSAASIEASQQVVELKTQRHDASEVVRRLRVELAEQQSVLTTIDHRIAATSDLLRLKQQGIGALPRTECPTCHQEVAPAAMSLSEQSTASVEIHLGAIRQERLLIARNISASEGELRQAAHQLGQVETRLADAQRSLLAVTEAVGTQREELAKIANDLVSAERELEKMRDLRSWFESLKHDMHRWAADVAAKTLPEVLQADEDLEKRLKVFTEHLRRMLLALGHSEVSTENCAQVRLDERYTPYLGPRRLRSLGSASDHARLVAAYAIALALASNEVGGPHPGFVLLDEPLQQNPDPEHKELMIHFLCHEAPTLGIQLVVFTSLSEVEIERFQDHPNIHLQAPTNDRFLRLTS